MHARIATLGLLFVVACERDDGRVEALEARISELEAEQQRTLTSLRDELAAVEARVARLEQTQPSVASSDASEPVGVAECDQFVASAMRCIESKMPENARADARATVAESAAQWRVAAKDPAQRDALAQTCQKALALSKQAYASLGCEM